MKLPGQDFAIERGYTLNSYSGDRTQATYERREDDEYNIFLTCTAGMCKMEKYIGLITCTTDWIQFPNSHFDIFEQAIIAIRRPE